MPEPAQHGTSGGLRKDGMPVGRPFVPGNNLNPGGLTKYERELRAAIQKQETPDKVCAVIEAMREDAMAHEKFSPAAAKVYLQAVGVRLNQEPAKVDWSNAPDEVIGWVADNLQQ